MRVGPERATLAKAADRWLAPLSQLVAAQLGPRVETADAMTTVVRPGGLGDLVCATIALEEIGTRPTSVHWVIEERAMPWALHLGLPHTIIDRRLLRRASRPQASTVLDLEQRFGLSRAIARTLAPRTATVIGFHTNRGGRRGDGTVPYDARDEHEVIAFSRLFRAAGLGSKDLRGSPLRARKTPASGAPVVALAGTQAPSRRLSAHDWSSLIRRALSDDVVITAAPIDMPLARAVQAELGRGATIAPAGFEHVVDAIATAPRVLTIDGGMVHVASYFGTPTTAIFTSGRDKKWRPLAIDSELLMNSRLSCRPCTVFGQTPRCPHAYVCCRIEDLRRVGPMEAEATNSPG